MRKYRPTGDLNFTALAVAYATERGKPTAEAAEDVQAMLDVIGRTVAAGYRVRLTNFGSIWQGTHHIAAGALGGRVERATIVRTVKFHASGKLLDAVRSGRKVTTLRKSPKTVKADPNA